MSVGFEHRGPDGTWTPFDAAQSAVIDAALREAADGDGAVWLPDTPYEIRFGSAAVSYKMPKVPSTKMIQVIHHQNIFDNTQQEDFSLYHHIYSEKLI